MSDLSNISEAGLEVPILAHDLLGDFGLVRNMPFIDGNKRTAHVCYRVFLDLNHALLEASDEEMYLQMLALAEGMHDEDDFSKWLRPRIRD